MPTDRTKQQAMERPAPEDAWDKYSGSRIVKRFDGQRVTYWDGTVELKAVTLKAFRRWCATAEYLGGAK